MLEKGMRFAANLRKRSIEAFSSLGYKPDAWLLSVHRLNNRSLNYARYVKKRRVPLFADNGTKELIDAVISTYTQPAKKLHDKVPVQNGNGGLPERIAREFQDLASQVVEECIEKSEDVDSESVLKQQLSMKPTHVIAQEDFGVACLIALDLSREFTGWGVKEFNKRNRRSLGLWKRVQEDSRCDKTRVYAVLSAMDYDTAYSAGRIAAKKGAENIAIGLAGILLDLTTVDSFEKGGEQHMLKNPVRRRYVRFAQIVSGLADGCRSYKKKIKGFHALGLGAPTLFPVLVAAMKNVSHLSVDSTSPIHAVVRQNTLFDPNRDGDRISLIRIVERILSGADWDCKGPFCSHFMKMFGHDPDTARRWWESNGRPAIEERHLKMGEPIADALPLFSDSLDSPFLDNTRIAHNHWVMKELTKGVSRIKRRRRKWALKRIDEMISYESKMTARGLQAAKKILTI